MQNCSPACNGVPVISDSISQGVSHASDVAHDIVMELVNIQEFIGAAGVASDPKLFCGPEAELSTLSTRTDGVTTKLRTARELAQNIRQKLGA